MRYTRWSENATEIESVGHADEIARLKKMLNIVGEGLSR
jgi:hypothetical protein